jgi:hypothetical protein
MIDNFKTRKINKDTRKLVRTPTLKKKNSKLKAERIDARILC